jgi:hypothetical protein
MLLRYTVPARKLVVAAALVTLAAGWLVKFSRVRVRRRQAWLRSLPAPLQGGEGEAQVPSRETSQTQTQTQTETQAQAPQESFP